MNDDRSTLIEHGRTMWRLGFCAGFALGAAITGVLLVFGEYVL